MPRVRFEIGVRFQLAGEVYRVGRVLIGDRLLIESQSLGVERTVARDELESAWAAGQLVFEVRGRNSRSEIETTIVTGPTIVDLGGLPASQRDEAWRRYQLILPLVQLQPHERTRAAVQAYATSLGPSTAGPSTTRRTRSAVGRAVSAGSIERWMRVFVASGYDIRSLVPATRRQGGKGRDRLSGDIERLTQSVLADCAARPGYRTRSDVYLMVVNRVADENAHRATAEKLLPPSASTVYRRIESAGADTILGRRRSRMEKQAGCPTSQPTFRS
ncbi:MAG: hypothetical protein M3Q65_13285 [Chloroflexota bacterium]|nr:hypothetical protein [Chloroflexota bacterium]